MVSEVLKNFHREVSTICVIFQQILSRITIDLGRQKQKKQLKQVDIAGGSYSGPGNKGSDLELFSKLSYWISHQL